jgi:hypothetical protein
MLELRNLFLISNIIRVMKSRKIIWTRSLYESKPIDLLLVFSAK